MRFISRQNLNLNQPADNPRQRRNTPATPETPKPSLLTKRQRIVLVSIIMCIGLLFTLSNNLLFYRVQFVIGLGIVAYFLSLWALWEGMTKLKALMLLLLPSLFTVAIATFSFLIKPGWVIPLWMIKVFTSMVYGLSFYSILLSQNVFNVAAASRTIPLYRAASTVTFLFTLITGFLMFGVVLSFNLPFYLNGLIVVVISFLLSLPTLWSVNLEDLKLSLLIYAGLVSLMVGQMAMALSFWPIATTMWSLFLSTSLYLLLGMMTEILKERATPRIIYEYIGIGLGVLLFTFLATSWTGY